MNISTVNISKMATDRVSITIISSMKSHTDDLFISIFGCDLGPF